MNPINNEKVTASLNLIMAGAGLYTMTANRVPDWVRLALLMGALINVSESAKAFTDSNNTQTLQK